MRQPTIITAAAVAAFVVLSSLVPASAEYFGAAPNVRTANGVAAADSARNHFGTWHAAPAQPAGLRRRNSVHRHPRSERL
jgi:hypothetical protein